MENPGAGGSEGAKETVYRFLVLRMIVATFIVGAGMMIIQVTDEPFAVRPLYLLLGLSALSGGAAYLAVRMCGETRATLWALVVSDIAIEAAIVHYSGGVGSQFSLIYCLTIVASAFLLRMTGGLAAAVMASTAYVAFGILETVGVITPPGVTTTISGVGGAHVSAASAAWSPLEIYMHVLMFFLVGTVGGYLAARIRAKGRALATAEFELERLKIDTDSILNNMSSGILVIDFDGVVVTMNPAAEQILGVGRSEVMLKDVDRALGARVPELTSELLGALDDERSKYRHEITIETAEGGRTPLGTSISLLRDTDGSKRGAISVFQDLTEVQEMRDRIRKADRLAAIGELAAGIAHELRNPLASISGSIEMLSNELDLSGEDRRLMTLITRESDRLDRIISDFLDFAKLRAPRRRTVSVGTCLDEVLTLLRNNAAKSEGVRIELEQRARGVHLSVDDEQLRQVFLILAINACEAMDSQGSLRIVTWQESPGWLNVSFHDDGPGIDGDDIERLFEPFFTTKDGGTGLGLAIANRIVIAHGGEIRFQNRGDGGAEFTVILPIGSTVSQSAGNEAADIGGDAGAERVATISGRENAGDDAKPTAVGSR